MEYLIAHCYLMGRQWLQGLRTEYEELMLRNCN